MRFGVAGVNYTTAHIEEREKIVISTDQLFGIYTNLMTNQMISECIVLSTCNRTELYAVVNDQRENAILDCFRTISNIRSIDESMIYTMYEKDAVKHLCKVACGLDSMILGETQITGQIKDAFTRAKDYKTVGYMLNHIFSQVFSCVKKVRSKTAIGEKNVSVSYAAVKLSQKILGDLKNKKVMILGAGDTGELTVRNLKSAGCSDVTVANRTFVRAVELASKFDGLPIMLHEIVDYIHSVDIIISSIAVTKYQISYEDIVKARMNKTPAPLLLIDISVPRSIDPEVINIENVFLCNIDDLQSVTKENVELRKKEAEKGIKIIEQQMQSMTFGLELYNLIPTLEQIRSKAEEIRKECVENSISSVYMNSSDLAIIDEMTKSIVNKILFHSESKIKQYSFSLKKR